MPAHATAVAPFALSALTTDLTAMASATLRPVCMAVCMGLLAGLQTVWANQQVKPCVSVVDMEHLRVIRPYIATKIGSKRTTNPERQTWQQAAASGVPRRASHSMARPRIAQKAVR